ncbi:MAG: manganese efflux pump MntP family protein [Lachnospirales bacterium]
MLFTVIVISVALAMDAFAVSISNGVSIKSSKKYIPCLFGIFFGFFQFLMPVLGYYGGVLFLSFIDSYSRFICFTLLFFIGAKMFIEAYKSDDLCEIKVSIGLKTLISLSIATSIDAFAVGITFALDKVPIWSASIVIGVVAFIFSVMGFLIGKKLGCVFEKGSEYFGGIVLIIMAVLSLF